MPPRDPDDRAIRDEIDLRALRAGDPAAGGQGSGPSDDDLGRIGDIVRSLSSDDLTRDEPPPAVWQGIVARTGASATPARDVVVEEAAPALGPEAADAPAAEAPAAEAPAGRPPSAPPSLRSVEGGTGDRAPAPRHRAPSRASRLRRPWTLAAAAAVVIVLVVGGVAFARLGDDAGSVVASAELEPLPDEPTGAAVPVRADLVDKDGSLRLDLSTADLPAPAGYYEVWLIDTDIEGMVSLGPARADGTYAVPADVDPGAFPIVDVSIEPPDGDPTHSGVSVLRGTLA